MERQNDGKTDKETGRWKIGETQRQRTEKTKR